MKRSMRFLALFIALLMPLSAAGCAEVEQFKGVVREAVLSFIGESEQPDQPQQPIQPEPPAPGATPALDPAAGEALAALDLALFRDAVTSDPLTLKLSLKDPDAFGVETPEATWGELSYEDSRRYAEERAAFLAELLAIDRAALSEQEQLTYDTIRQDLETDVAAAQYYYYEEVLSPYSGLHTNLPFNFIFYELDNEEDVENYLALLLDAARYMGEDVLRFEQEKAARGTFMPDAALEEVLGQIGDFANAGETCFLYATFADALAELGLPADAEAEYLARNEAAVDALLEAYGTLYDGLAALRGSAKGTGALFEHGEEGLDYFELGLNYAACSIIAPEDALEVLNEELDHDFGLLYSAILSDPDVYEQYDSIELTVGTSEENLAYLEAMMEGYYPELPEHTVRFTDVPEELEGQFSPAAYLVPPVDDVSGHTIIINPAAFETDTRLLDAIAHEGYPGHMYHYIYVRGLAEETGWYRQSMSLTGYYESWSQYAENFFDANNTAFSNAYCVMMSADFRISALLLPAAVSIGVHYFGWDEAEVTRYVAECFGSSPDDMGDLGALYYGIALGDPFYYLEYAMGYSLLQQELRDAQDALGGRFDYLAFNEAFLSIGPTYFNLIEPRLEAWVASQHERG